MPRLLIVDDNESIIEILKTVAAAEGYETIAAVDGESALREFHEHEIDLVLLDVMLPDRDGFEICREMRRESNIPIIMITARGDDYDRIMGLDTGADDYIVKPFSPAEVMARARAVLRRLDRGVDDSHKNSISYGNIIINADKCSAAVGGEPVALTRKEFDLLWLLMKNKGRVFSREHLLESLWGDDYMGDTRAVDTHIKRLRAKLARAPREGWRIKTVWGVGYSFEAEP